MSRTKNFLEGLHLSDHELNEELVSKLEKIYNQYDIANALQYASDGINIEPQEVGKELYDKLFSQKVLEYLNKQND